MEIRDKEYAVTYDALSGNLRLSGTLRLMTKDYREIQELLEQILRATPPRLDIDLQALEMLNSSGLNTLSRFVLGLRTRPGTKVTIHGSRRVVWHAKTLTNMKHFLPTAELAFH